MKVNWLFIVFVAWWAAVAGSMLSDIGEVQEAFTVELCFAVSFSLIVWGSFIVGFLVGKENRE